MIKHDMRSRLTTPSSLSLSLSLSHDPRQGDDSQQATGCFDDRAKAASLTSNIAGHLAFGRGSVQGVTAMPGTAHTHTNTTHHHHSASFRTAKSPASLIAAAAGGSHVAARCSARGRALAGKCLSASGEDIICLFFPFSSMLSLHMSSCSLLHSSRNTATTNPGAAGCPRRDPQQQQLLQLRRR